MPEKFEEVIMSEEDKALGEIEGSKDKKTILEYNKVSGIDLLTKKTYSSEELGKEVVLEREWDLGNPLRNNTGVIAGYNIKEEVKRITKE